jgi:hypothetical protein
MRLRPLISICFQLLFTKQFYNLTKSRISEWANKLINKINLLFVFSCWTIPVDLLLQMVNWKGSLNTPHCASFAGAEEGHKIVRRLCMCVGLANKCLAVFRSARSDYWTGLHKSTALSAASVIHKYRFGRANWFRFAKRFIGTGRWQMYLPPLLVWEFINCVARTEAVRYSEMLVQIWANYFALERPLRAARNGRSGSLGHAVLKTFISGFSSGQQFKSCSRVHSVSYVNVLFVF